MYSMVRSFTFLLATLLLASSQSTASTFWQARDMTSCRSNLRSKIKFDGRKSTIEIPDGNSAHFMAHSVEYADLATDEFVMEFGEVSPGISWELGGIPLDRGTEWLPLIKGTGGGTYRVPLSKLGLPSWVSADVELRIRAEKPGTMEIIRWAVETPEQDKFAEQRAKASKELADATPLERGTIPHWNPEIGGFVCAYNATHPEHYNYWLEDEGQQLWSFGNYPKMMKLYGKELRDFIIKHCKNAIPVRKVGNSPLLANPYLTGGEYWLDTGILLVNGNLAASPHVNMHQSTYEYHGLLASLGNFFVSYKAPCDRTARIEFAKPSSYRIDYDKPKRNSVQLVIEAGDSAVLARFTITVFRGRVSIHAKVANKGNQDLHDVTAGFDLQNCNGYFTSPLDSFRRFGKVAIFYSDQPLFENCNFVRLAGRAAKSVKIQRTEDKIKQVTASAVLCMELPAGAKTSRNIANVTAGAISFANKIEIYKDMNFENANVSMPYVCTYPLLGLATYCYRFPADRGAREVADAMIDNFLGARDRLRDRELGYLLWVLNLFGRNKEAVEIADLIEKRAEGQKQNSQIGSSMAIGLRSMGRWAAADKIVASIEEPWTTGVSPPTDFLGFGALQSPAAAETCYEQLSTMLAAMHWDEPDRITSHTFYFVEEGSQEVQAYTLICFDLISRLYGGIVPIRLDPFANTKITNMSFDETSGEWRVTMTKAKDIDVFTHFRPPKRILWNGRQLDVNCWKYKENTGVVYFSGLSGDGELSITVEGDPPKPDRAWTPIDYIGLAEKP